MKVLIYSDKGGVGKSTLAVDVLPFFFRNEEVVVIDADPVNFTSQAVNTEGTHIKFERIEVDAVSPGIRRKIGKLFRKTENLIIDTPAGVKATELVELLEKAGVLSQIDLAIIPLGQGGAGGEGNALISYIKLKEKGVRRFLFALISPTPGANFEAVKINYVDWFGRGQFYEEELELILQHVNVEADAEFGKKIKILGGLEKEVDEGDRNYIIVPHLPFLRQKWGLRTIKPAFAYLEEETEADEVEERIEELVHQLLNAGEAERKKDIANELLKWIGRGADHLIVDFYKPEIIRFYEEIEKQAETVLSGAPNPLLAGET